MASKSHVIDDVVPYLIVADAPAAISFYISGLGAVEDHRLTMQDGKVGHAELRLGGAACTWPTSFRTRGNSPRAPEARPPVGLVLHVDDLDAAVQQARDAGATIDRDVVEEVFGARCVWLSDPFGHRWNLRQQVRAMTPAETKAAITEQLDLI